MTNFKEFDVRHAFEAESRDFHASELAGGALPADVRLTWYQNAPMGTERKYSLGLVSEVLFHKAEGLRDGAVDRAIKDLQVAYGSLGIAHLDSTRQLLTPVLESAQSTRMMWLNARATSLDTLVNKVDAWVSLREPCDTPLILNDGAEEVDLAGTIVPVARLKGFDIRRTQDDFPDPVAIVEGVDGVQGFYPHRMDLFIGSSVLDQIQAN